MARYIETAPRLVRFGKLPPSGIKLILLPTEGAFTDTAIAMAVTEDILRKLSIAPKSGYIVERIICGERLTVASHDSRKPG